ncbi:MAG: DMT family transporter [Motiliproteus sp.]|nr:DMT family transporter [Motiliproteus sp.]MCW9053408.1 DMT family transporter [Motiliproteus sp.]
MTAALYLATLFIWGGSWLAIKFQAGPVPIPVAVFHRFLLAALLMMLLMVLFRRLQKASVSDHGFFLLQACCLFSFNFMAFYAATHYIASGLVAVVMSTATLFNAMHGRIFWGSATTLGFRLGAPLGILGLLLLFWTDLQSSQWSADALLGIGYALLGTWLFSLGNMVSVRHANRGIQPATSNAWGMIYGCVILLLIIILRAGPWVWDGSVHYLGGLAYLSILASVVGFSTYLMLVNRIGANNAAYVLVATPVIALTLSNLYEGYQWSLLSIFGLVLIAVGNLAVLGWEKLKWVRTDFGRVSVYLTNRTR